MNDPVWISREVILSTQEELLERFGGLAGIRDETLLESALHRPQHLFAYGKPTLFELATAYAAGIVKNHPFLDGDKRAGFMAAYIFLGANGCEVEAHRPAARWSSRDGTSPACRCGQPGGLPLPFIVRWGLTRF